MNAPEKVTYQLLCNFLTGENEWPQIHTLEKEIPVYGIYSFMKEHYTTLTQYSDEKNLSFNDTQEYLEKYLAGNFSKKEAYALTNAILNSPRNFSKLNYLIEQHVSAIMGYRDASKEQHALSDEKILAELQNLNNNSQRVTFATYKKHALGGIFAVAASLLFFLVITFETNQKLSTQYNFDHYIPLDYNGSVPRGSESANKTTDPAYNRFKFQFNKGMSEYLALEYSAALREWQALENNLSLLKENPYFTEQDENDFLFYNAVCHMALYLSENEKVDDEKKHTLLNKAISMLQRLPLESDDKKYFYALALGLNDNKTLALEALNTINQSSEYYHKRMVLEEQLNQ